MIACTHIFHLARFLTPLRFVNFTWDFKFFWNSKINAIASRIAFFIFFDRSYTETPVSAYSSVLSWVLEKMLWKVLWKVPFKKHSPRKHSVKRDIVPRRERFLEKTRTSIYSARVKIVKLKEPYITKKVVSSKTQQGFQLE